MDREAYREAYAQMVAHMQAGQSWHEAASSAGIQTSRATAYHLLRRVRIEGAAALEEHQHQSDQSPPLGSGRLTPGVRRPASGAGKNHLEESPLESTWHEGAGSLLLLAAAHETGLITALEQALPTGEQAAPRRAHSTPATRRQSLLTLLLLGAVGLRRPCSGEALALLSGRQRAYGYCQCERFLSQVARAGGDETLTDALAKWTNSSDLNCL